MTTTESRTDSYRRATAYIAGVDAEVAADSVQLEPPRHPLLQ